MEHEASVARDTDRSAASETDQIEADLMKSRAKLASSMAILRGRLSPGSLAEEAVRFAGTNVATVGHLVDGAIRKNPIAAAMIGAGAAWLIFGRNNRTPEIRSGEILAGTKFEALSRWEDEGGPVAPLADPDHRWVMETDTLRDRARQSLQRIDGGVRDKILSPADAAKERTTVLSHLARDVQVAIRLGLENLSKAAQDKISAAREKAYLAGYRAAHKGARMIEDQPLWTGGIAFALGAVAACALPHTEAENRLFGAERDKWLRRAEDLLRQERARMAGVLSDTVGTMRQELHQASASIVGA